MMSEGLLWYDGDGSRPLEEKVRLAAEAYERKHGRRPNVCYIGSAGEEFAVDDVLVKWNRSVLPNHFWLGEDTGVGRQMTRVEEDVQLALELVVAAMGVPEGMFE